MSRLRLHARGRRSLEKSFGPIMLDSRLARIASTSRLEKA